MSGRFNGDDDDEYSDEYSEESAIEYFQDIFEQLDFADDFKWSEIDAFDLETAREIMENIFDSGMYPSEDTMSRLEDLTGADYDYWETIWDYFDEELDLDRYSED